MRIPARLKKHSRTVRLFPKISQRIYQLSKSNSGESKEDIYQRYKKKYGVSWWQDLLIKFLIELIMKWIDRDE